MAAAAAYSTPIEPLSGPDREKLILEHLPQVRLIARRIHERVPDSVCFDDLMSAGVVGLIQAIDNFDPRQNVRLRTYAEFRIRGAILDSLREADWAPRQKRKRARELESALSRAEQRLGRTPEDVDIAAELGIPLSEYHQRLTEMDGLNIGEIEFGREGDDRPAVLQIAAAEDDSPSRILERTEIERLMANAIGKIPKVERTVLSLYFYEELTLREIAGILDLHFSRVSQIKTQAILRLRAAIAARWSSRSAPPGGIRQSV